MPDAVEILTSAFWGSARPGMLIVAVAKIRSGLALCKSRAGDETRGRIAPAARTSARLTGALAGEVVLSGHHPLEMRNEFLVTEGGSPGLAQDLREELRLWTQEERTVRALLNHFIRPRQSWP
jgi:hypothetical protein